MVPRLTIDFETRSAAKLKNVGGWMYSIHPSTEPICMAYSLGETDEPKLWAPDWAANIVESWYLDTYGVPIDLDCPWLITGLGLPGELRDAIATNHGVEAHNAFFERSIWQNVMQSRFGWPMISENQWRCSAAKAASYALPRALEDAISVLGLPFPKDMIGNRIMQKICRPRKARKAEKKQLLTDDCRELGDGYGWMRLGSDTPFYLWSEEPEDIFRTWEYCRQDVRAERALSQALSDLSPAELAVWRTDQAINLRGVRIDRKMAEAALNIAAQTVEQVTKEAIRAATVYHENGDVAWPAPFKTLGQRDKIKSWVENEGVCLPDMRGATIDQLLEDETLPDNVRTVLQCKRVASRTSVRKYAKMLDTADPADDRIRDVFMYHGAGTGRWSGRFVQTQNLVRGKMKDPDTMCGIIREGSASWVDACYGPTDAMTVLSWATRGALCAPPGRDLVVADYSGVEARGLLWFVGDEEGLQIFRRPKGEPGIYREMASAIYNKPALDIKPDERQMGKQAILGLGYGMGAPKFQGTCAGYGIDVSLSFSEYVVKTYRDRFHLVPAAWRELENAAIEAVRNPEKPIRAFSVVFMRRGKFLYCRLPSGRNLAYFKPSIKSAPTPWGEMRPKLSYMTVDGQTHKFVRTDTYGGKLMENVIQGLCRDLEAYAMVAIENDPASPYDIVMHTHDELVAECDEGRGSVEEFEQLIAQVPDWAFGFPLNAEGWRGKRYRK